MKKIILHFVPIVQFLVFSCGEKQIDTKKFSQEMGERTIQRVNTGQITEQAIFMGDTIIKLVNNEFTSRLTESISSNGLNKSVMNCTLKGLESIKTAENEVHCKIERLGVKSITRNRSTEIALMEAYQYNISKNLPLESTVQVDGNKIVYISPIVAKNETCLKCHGTPNDDLNELLKKNNPSFKNTGIRQNELIGIWVVKLHQKEVISKISTR